MSAQAKKAPFWGQVATRFLPFADAATRELPLERILRLSLFQVSVGMAAVLLTGTLNRVMIVELGMSSSLVAAMISLPLLFAPARALIGFKSDNHSSLLGWKRVPYIWFGTLLQFGGLAILPFALLVMSGRGDGSAVVGEIGAGIAFLMVGAGMHCTQTAGLALATDLAPEHARPRVVALLYVMLLAGMMVSALVIGRLLADFSPLRLIKVVQGAAALTMIFNLIALWKQEARAPRGAPQPAPADFGDDWRAFIRQGRASRLLVSTGLGAAAFAMQDVLLEPYGGQVLGLGVGATTSLTAVWAFGMMCGFGFAAKRLAQGGEPHRLAGFGAVAGIAAFLGVIFAGTLGSPILLAAGAGAIGLGAGLFAVGTLTSAMTLADGSNAGLALGAWGAVQATAAGLAIAIGALLKDTISSHAVMAHFGATLAAPATGYIFVYALEIILLFATLIAIGPLVRVTEGQSYRFGLAEFPS